MDQVSRFLTSPIASGIALLLGVAALVTGYIYYLRAKREKRPLWVIVTTNVVGKVGDELGESLSVHYKRRAISTVSISRIAFWNAGSQTINKDDIPPGDRLRIATTDPSHRVLEVRVIGHNSAGSQFDSEPVSEHGAREVPIRFDFMDRTNGCVFQVIHTGLSSADLALRGTLKGAQPLHHVPARRALTAVFPRADKGRVVVVIGLVAVMAIAGGLLFATRAFRDLASFLAVVGVVGVNLILVLIDPLSAWRKGDLMPDTLRGFLRD